MVMYRKGDASVDSKQFDELVARLASGQSRRKALMGIAGGALASVGVTSVASAKNRKARAEGSRNKAKAEACIPTGKKCPAPKPRGKSKKKLGCNKCCQRFVDTSGSKNKCACIPDTVACERDAYCCSNNCVSGKCQPYGT
jgi:hypothetical protein